MKKTLSAVAGALAAIVAGAIIVATPAEANNKRAVEAGPIWNQDDANQKCPQVAQREGGHWTGQWWTTVQGQMSVCEIVYQTANGVTNGRNVKRVEFGRDGQHYGSYVQTGPKSWQEQPTSASGATFNFTEQRRDDWSVYLHDASRHVHIQLDLHTRIIYYSDANSPRRELYQIQSASQSTGQAAPAANAFDPNRYYRLTTLFRGDGMSLDIHNGGDRNNMPHLAPTAGYTGQFWKITPAGSGWVRLSTQFRGAGMCLDVYNGGPRNNMPHLTQCANYSGQFWKIKPTGQGTYRLTNQFRGDNMCLDIYNGGDYNNGPHLAPCADYSGQFWKVTPIQ